MNTCESSHKAIAMPQSGRVGLGSRRVHHASFFQWGRSMRALEQLLRARLRAVAWGVHSEVRSGPIPVRQTPVVLRRTVDLFLVDLHGLPAERALGDGPGVGVEARWLLVQRYGVGPRGRKATRWAGFAQGWWSEAGRHAFRACFALVQCLLQTVTAESWGRWILRQEMPSDLEADGIPAVIPAPSLSAWR